MDLRELAAQLRKPQGKGGIEIGQVMNKGNALLRLGNRRVGIRS